MEWKCLITAQGYRLTTGSMKNWFTYFHYFFYIGINWNFRLATVILYNEIKGEKKYGIQSSGFDELKKLKKKNPEFTQSTVYMPVGYNVLEDIFIFMKNKNKIHFLDIGCGKGRAMAVAIYFGFRKASGIDISEKLLAAARRNLENILKIFPGVSIDLHFADARNYKIPDDTDCIFFFNPFGKEDMQYTCKNIFQSLQRNPRELFIVYANPLYKEIFTSNGFREIFYRKELNYLEASILKNDIPE